MRVYRCVATAPDRRRPAVTRRARRGSSLRARNSARRKPDRNRCLVARSRLERARALCVRSALSMFWKTRPAYPRPAAVAGAGVCADNARTDERHSAGTRVRGHAFRWPGGLVGSRSTGSRSLSTTKRPRSTSPESWGRRPVQHRGRRARLRPHLRRPRLHAGVERHRHDRQRQHSSPARVRSAAPRPARAVGLGPCAKRASTCSRATSSRSTTSSRSASPPDRRSSASPTTSSPASASRKAVSRSTR